MKMEQPRPEQRFWLVFVGFAALVLLAASTSWILAHPYAVQWDEASYFNQALTSIWRVHTGTLRQIVGVLLGSGDSTRPPAYRVLVLPFLWLFGLHIAAARFSSLALSCLSAAFLFSATRRVASPAAGAFALFVFLLSPEVVASSIFFSTEAPLFLATSAMLYFLFVFWSGGNRPADWIGLGLAVALGLLSKTSFVLIAGPVFIFALIVSFRSKPRVTGPAFLFKAGALAALVAVPWWVRNIGPALHYASYARDWTRSSLGTPSLLTWGRWFNTVLQGLLGHGVSILIGLVVIFALRKAIFRRQTLFDPLQKTALLACACAGLPLIVVQLSGTNHLLRHISPVVIPLAITVGVLAETTGWLYSKLALAVSGVLLVAQLVMIVGPVLSPNRSALEPKFVNSNGGVPWRAMIRFDQWDWTPLREISHNCGLETPKIALLGNGRGLNEAQISYFWVVEGATSPEVTWLWRYEQGPLDWQQVNSAIDSSDIVLTAPNYVGEVTDKQDVDNQHNAEFAERLAHDSRFRGPVSLKMGRFEPVEVTVFLRKSLVCGPAQKVQSQP
jgi:hypothetical protein